MSNDQVMFYAFVESTGDFFRTIKCAFDDACDEFSALSNDQSEIDIGTTIALTGQMTKQTKSTIPVYLAGFETEDIANAFIKAIRTEMYLSGLSTGVTPSNSAVIQMLRKKAQPKATA